MKLTPQQHAAIHRTGQDVCVIAGPGSGKTRVLAERFAWLVLSQNISPRNILALTFTEKAANEIRSRVAKTNHPDIDFAPISTFHGLCKRLLTEFSIAAGLDPTTQLWDDRIAASELHASIEHVLNDAAHTGTATLRRLFTTYNSSSITTDLRSLYNQIRSLSTSFPQPDAPPSIPNILPPFLALGEDILNTPPTTPKSREFHEAFREHFARLTALGLTPSWQHIDLIEGFPKRGNLPKPLSDIARQFYDLHATIISTIVLSLVHPERNYLIELLNRIHSHYSERKLSAARLDFNDLEHHTLHLLERNSRVREELQRRFEHILMDEMQDTNPIQWQLLSLLRTPGSFFAVGDVNQSIYGFRFAAPEEFIAYRDSLLAQGAVIDYLGDNFRTRPEILDFTNTLASALPGLQPPNLSSGRRFTTADTPLSIHAFSEDAEEFAFLVSEIQHLSENFVVEPKDGSPLRRLSLSDIAILVRTAAKAEAIAAALASHDIPYLLSGGRMFFDTQEVADCLNWLHYLANPLNTIARATVLRSPFASLSDGDILSGLSSPALDALHASQRARLDTTPPGRFLTELLDTTGYLSQASPAVAANVDKLLSLIRSLWREQPSHLPAFVAELERMRAAAQEKSAPVPSCGEAVQILTVHASKGLEFPVVFLPGCYFHSPPNRSSLLFGRPDRIGVRWNNPLTGVSLPDLLASRIIAARKLEDSHELERQLFVALTRAEQRLYLSWAGEQKRGWVKHLAGFSGKSWPAGLPTPLPPLAAPIAPAAPILLAPLPSQPVQLSSANPTDLALYATCPRHFFLSRLAAITYPQDAPPDGAANLGSLVHQLLAGQLPSVPPPPEALQLVAVATNSSLAAELASALWVEREFDFVFSLDGLVIEGAIDLCFESPAGHITLIDYKTGQPRPRSYALQMALYREAISRLYPGKPIRSELFFLSTGERLSIDTPLDRSLLHRFQSATDFSTQPGAHCQRCPHLSRACPVN